MPRGRWSFWNLHLLAKNNLTFQNVVEIHIVNIYLFLSNEFVKFDKHALVIHVAKHYFDGVNVW